MIPSRPNRPHLAAAALALLALTGCSSHLVQTVSQTVPLHLQGKVHGGQQPVVGAAIQLFDISAAGGFGPAHPLISSTVLSDANGAFTITGDYTCPSSTDQVYLAAVGGNPGSGTNADLVMLTALGNCGSLTPSTFIFVNEVTTVATVWAYADDYDNSQTGGANIDQQSGPSEYQNFLDLVNPTTGVALTTNGTAVQLQLNALANTLSTCVNSSTDSNGDSPACDHLLSLAGAGQGFAPGANDSSEAVFYIAVGYDSSGYNTAAIYMDAPPSPPFQPTLPSSPSSWYLGFEI